MIYTAGCDKRDLLAARNTAGLSRFEVANEVGVSPETVRRWETPLECNPGPDDVWRLGKLYKAPNLWHGWMQSHYDSYREMYPGDAINYTMALTIVNTRHQMMDVLRQQDAVERDAIDGKLDNRHAAEQYRTALETLQATITHLIQQIEKGGIT